MQVISVHWYVAYMDVDERTQNRDIIGELPAIYGIDVQRSGTEAQKSLSIGELYHDPPRKTFLQLHEYHQSLKNDVLLAITTMEINDSLGPDGVVPCTLVIGEFPLYVNLLQ